MTIEEDYLQSILSEIASLKERGRKSLFKANAKIPDRTAMYLKNYFNGRPEYNVEIRKCRSCRQTWDIIIIFRNI